VFSMRQCHHHQCQLKKFLIFSGVGEDCCHTSFADVGIGRRTGI
jgi:hypothetical protein